MIVDEDLLLFVDPNLTNHVLETFKSQGDGSSDEVMPRYIELIKFLFLTSKHPKLRGTFIPVTQTIDNFWHEAILQTRYYEKFCKRLPSGEFIHHESMSFHHYRAAKSKDLMIEEILQWATLYVHNFGDFCADRVKYWFFISKVLEVLNLSIGDFNQYAKKAPYLSLFKDGDKKSPNVSMVEQLAL